MMATVKKQHVELSFEKSGVKEEEEELDSDDSSDPGVSCGESSGNGSDGEENGKDEGDSGEEEEEEEAGKEDAGEEGNSNAGWAEAMAKVLGKKTPQNQSGIPLKNKQLDKMKAKEKQERMEQRSKVDKKRAWEMVGRVKPDVVADRESEKALQRTATRGVVQLFNAVKKHQKTIDEKVKEVGGSERKKAKILSAVSKRDFIDVLRGTEAGASIQIKKEKVTDPGEGDKKPSWSVLRDDFMMGASMKDWDKASDGEDAPAGTGGAPEDSDSD